MGVITKYVNGDYTFTIYSDGTLVRETDSDNPKVVHPSSIDVKITDYCDMGCSFCHESSTTKGKHANLNILLSVISELPSGVELAMGGGNPLSHPDLISFLVTAKERGLICNITINQGHIKPYFNLISYLIKDGLVNGVGISITNNNFTYIEKLHELTDNIVYHVIAGVNKFDTIYEIVKGGDKKVLVLGYKMFGFGVNYYNTKINEEIKVWYKNIHKLIGECTLCFDNLAIEQLKVRRLFTKEGWECFYMGDDFCFTMYIDAVNMEFAPTSRSEERKSFTTYSLLEYFNTYKKT